MSKHNPISVEFETFRPFHDFEIQHLTDKEPSCTNGWVRIRKYRVRIEEKDEPDKVLQARVQELWDHSKNHYDGEHLIRVAKGLNYELQGNRGSKANRDD